MYSTGLHLVLCSVALNDAEGGKAAFHAMLDVEPPTYHQDIAIDDVSFMSKILYEIKKLFNPTGFASKYYYTYLLINLVFQRTQ